MDESGKKKLKSILIDADKYTEFKKAAKRNKYMIKPLVEFLMILFIENEKDYDDENPFIPPEIYRTLRDGEQI